MWVGSERIPLCASANEESSHKRQESQWKNVSIVLQGLPHVYNPFSDNSKAMIRDMGNVELFELCETIPKVQCAECLL